MTGPSPIGPARRRPSSRATLVAAAALAVGTLAGGLFVGIITLVLAIVWSPLRARRARAAAQRERIRSLPLTLDFLAVAVEAGLTPHQTVAVMVSIAPPPLRPAFVEITRRLDRGVGFADALAALPEAAGPTAAPATDALAIAHRHGSPLRDTINTIAADATRQRQVQASAAARQLPVLLSFPLVICVLPAFALIAVAPAVIGALDSFGFPTG